MNDKGPIKNLAPGKKYKIRLEDCCIQGEIIGIFQHWVDGDDIIIQAPVFEEDNVEVETAVFDIGSIGPGWGKWFPEEVLE
ncbi:MAG: hypothetical protein DHS20C20_04860 [Ardenticatenaceae bacterium]|nr:MAG: hypothetical protein DHS20C20_04860 [Ardenticatenaceae bacterium]